MIVMIVMIIDSANDDDGFDDWFNTLDLPEEGKESNLSSDHFKFVPLSDVSCEYSLSSKPVNPFAYV